MAQVLWVSVETPDRNGQGGQRRQYHQIRALIARGYDITVLVPRSKQDARSIGQITRIHRPRIAIFGRLVQKLVARMQRVIRSPQWHAIIVSHHESWWLVPYGGVASTPVLLDVHNVISAWHLAAGRDEASGIALKQEAEALRGATAVSTCSKIELQRLAHMHPESAGKLLVAPLGVDPQEWCSEAFDRTDPIVALFGSWGWSPNSLGLAWFMREVWSRVHDEAPGAVALVAGSGVTGEETWPESARFVGRVDDLAGFVASATVVAVPVLEGVGASVKFAEALASGAAVIATPDGANAFDAPPAFVSSDPEEWANWILERLQQRRAEPAPALSRGIALTEMTWDAAVAPIDEWLRAIGPVR